MTADSNSSATPAFEEVPCKWAANSKGIEATLHQIATGLQSAAEGYLALAFHMSMVMLYELPQVVAQILPPPMDVPMPIQKALLIDGESKDVNHLIHGEYKLNNTSWSKLHKNIMSVEIKYILPLKEKEDSEVPSTDKRRRNSLNPNQQHRLYIPNLLMNKNSFFNTTSYNWCLVCLVYFYIII